MSRRLRALLKMLERHPEVTVFEGELPELGRVRLELNRQDDPDEAGKEPEPVTAPKADRTQTEPVDWRWGTPQ